MQRTDGAVGRVVRVESWRSIPWLWAGFSTRHGGVSRVFGEGQGEAGEVGLDGDLNLGFGAKGGVSGQEADAEELVRENRRRLMEAVGGSWELVVSRQVHGTEVRRVSRGTLSEAMLEGRGQWAADGLVTETEGVLLGVGAADCVPLLLVDVRRRAVGAFHAGWRGTAAGMAGVAVERMGAEFGSAAEDCLAAVGPSIGVCCYEVGPDVAEAFADEDVREPQAGPVRWATAGTDRWRLDLWEANRRQMVRAGVPAEAVTVLGECTACTREEDGRRRYFSHRAEQGRAGRMLGLIGIV